MTSAGKLRRLLLMLLMMMMAMIGMEEVTGLTCFSCTSSTNNPACADPFDPAGDGVGHCVSQMSCDTVSQRRCRSLCLRDVL